MTTHADPIDIPTCTDCGDEATFHTQCHACFYLDGGRLTASEWEHVKAGRMSHGRMMQVAGSRSPDAVARRVRDAMVHAPTNIERARHAVPA